MRALRRAASSPELDLNSLQRRSARGVLTSRGAATGVARRAIVIGRPYGRCGRRGRRAVGGPASRAQRGAAVPNGALRPSRSGWGGRGSGRRQGASRDVAGRVRGEARSISLQGQNPPDDSDRRQSHRPRRTWTRMGSGKGSGQIVRRGGTSVRGPPSSPQDQNPLHHDAHPPDSPEGTVRSEAVAGVITKSGPSWTTPLPG